jgi:hypothetical protein
MRRNETINSAFASQKHAPSRSERRLSALVWVAIVWTLVPANLASGQPAVEAVEQTKTDTARGVSSQLVAYWSFDKQSDGKVPDATSLAHDGQLMGEATITPNGRFGGALDLNKPNSYMAVPSSRYISLFAPLDKRTVSAWFKVNDKDALHRKQVIYDEGGINVGMNIYIHRGRLYAGCWCRPPQGPQWPGVWLGTDMIESGCWYHVALVLDATDEYDDGALQAYLDGQLFGRGPGIQLPEHDDDGAVGTSVETTRFHEHQIFKGQGFRGLIDDLRIYNRALTAEEVKVLATLAPQPLAAQPPAEVDADGLEEP